MNPEILREQFFNEAADYVQARYTALYHDDCKCVVAEGLRRMGKLPPIEISILREKKNNIAIAFSSKNRAELSVKTILPLLEEARLDVYWIDGSNKPFDLRLPHKYAQHDTLKEIHSSVTGGPDVAITYALEMLFDKGYEFIGLLENDVLLEDGWFDKTMALFNLPGMDCGAASARCYTDRILEPRDGYAVMANVGAGMIIFRRACIEPVLKNYRCATVYELRVFFDYYLGKAYPLPACVRALDPQEKETWAMSCDWWWEAVLLAHGWQTFACTPSLARDLDPLPTPEPMQLEATTADEAVA